MRPLPLRTALLTTTVLCLVLLYLLWWTTYAAIGLEQRFAAQAAGQPAVSRGTSVTLVSLTRTLLLADQEYGDAPEPAQPGAVWVVALLDATRAADAPEFYCTLELAGAQGQRWTVQTQVNRTVPWCGKNELAPGATQRFEMIFLVPERYADQVVGVAVLDSSSTDPVPVIRPAR